MFKIGSFLLAIAIATGYVPASAESPNAASAFEPSRLVQVGDSQRYGSYLVFKIAEGVYKINDPGVTTGKGGAWGADFYLVCGKNKALLIDLGNDYVDGYKPDLLEKRTNAAAEFLNVVYGLAGTRTLEAAITHMHPDHDGMAGVLISKRITIWTPDGENVDDARVQHGFDPSSFTKFKTGEKTFDMGAGRVIKTFLMRGHTAGSTIYLLTKDMILFTSDAMGSGFGQAFPTVDRLKMFAEDSRNFVDYMKANFSPYQRYALRVYTGHTWQNTYAGFMGPNHAQVDVGYLDWRFVHDVSSCANGVLKGQWLIDGSGLIYVGKMAYTDAWPSAKGRAIMIYGTGTIIIPLETAYLAAGIPMPEGAK